VRIRKLSLTVLTMSVLVVQAGGCFSAPKSPYRQPTSSGFFERLVKMTGSPRYLTDREKAFFTSNPLAMQVVREADKYTDEAVGELCGSDRGDNEINAFKHYVIACYIGFHIGREKAAKFLFIHEGKPEICEKNTSKLCWLDEQRMDFYNNIQGIKCAQTLKTKYPNQSPFYRSLPVSNELKKMAKSALLSGEMSVLKLEESQYAPGCNRFYGLYPNKRHENIGREFQGFELIPSVLNPEFSEPQRRNIVPVAR